MRQAEVLVIGAGPGGYVAAIKLGQAGKKVLLVDRDKLGGECLNYGCIPSKALLSAANVIHKARKAADIGITFQGLQLDLAKLQQWKSSLLQGMNRGVATLTKGNGVEFLTGTARLTSPTSAEIKTPEGAAETIEFQQAILCPGTRPIEIPGFAFDKSNILSSKEALDLRELPERLLVIGGGAIGLEIGAFYAKLGSRVTVIEMLPQLLPGIEADLVAPVARGLQKLGAAVHCGSKAVGWRAQDGSLSVSLETPEGAKQVSADKILLSIGRAPVTDGLGLEAAGVATGPKGYIKVDAQYRTSAPRIYAVGDVSGPPLLAHKASREGILAAMAIIGEEPRPLGDIPWAVFTDPEVAFVGLSEAEARQNGREIQVGRFPFAASGRAASTRETEGFVKVIAEKGSGTVLGVGIVGPSASDLISEACLALRLKATLRDLASTLHPHPTLPEALMEAAEAATGRAIHVLARRA